MSRHMHYNYIDPFSNPRQREFGTTATIVVAAVVAVAAMGTYAYSSNQAAEAQKEQSEAIMASSRQSSIDEAKAKSAAQESMTQKRRAVARNETRHTGPLGLGAADQSSLNQKTLLGQ